MSNEEQMRAEFEAAFPFDKHGYALTELHWKVWQAASAKRDEERDSLANMQDIAIEKLNQQVLELSAQVEMMREALRMMLEAGESEYGEDWFAAAMNGRQALSIPPSSALLSHDNEVAAKALFSIADELSGSGMDSDCKVEIWLRRRAADIERRNRK